MTEAMLRRPPSPPPPETPATPGRDVDEHEHVPWIPDLLPPHARDRRPDRRGAEGSTEGEIVGPRVWARDGTDGPTVARYLARARPRGSAEAEEALAALHATSYRHPLSMPSLMSNKGGSEKDGAGRGVGGQEEPPARAGRRRRRPWELAPSGGGGGGSGSGSGSGYGGGYGGGFGIGSGSGSGSGSGGKGEGGGSEGETKRTSQGEEAGEVKDPMTDVAGNGGGSSGGGDNRDDIDNNEDGEEGDGEGDGDGDDDDDGRGGAASAAAAACGWSASEARAFATAVEVHGKDFYDVQRSYVPSRSVREIIGACVEAKRERRERSCGVRVCSNVRVVRGLGGTCL